MQNQSNSNSRYQNQPSQPPQSSLNYQAPSFQNQPQFNFNQQPHFSNNQAPGHSNLMTSSSYGIQQQQYQQQNMQNFNLNANSAMSNSNLNSVSKSKKKRRFSEARSTWHQTVDKERQNLKKLRIDEIPQGDPNSPFPGIQQPAMIQNPLCLPHYGLPAFMFEDKNQEQFGLRATQSHGNAYNNQLSFQSSNQQQQQQFDSDYHSTQAHSPLSACISDQQSQISPAQQQYFNKQISSTPQNNQQLTNNYSNQQPSFHTQNTHNTPSQFNTNSQLSVFDQNANNYLIHEQIGYHNYHLKQVREENIAMRSKMREVDQLRQLELQEQQRLQCEQEREMVEQKYQPVNQMLKRIQFNN
eukprot:403356708